MSLTAHHLTWKARSRTIVDRVSLSVDAGEVLGILGPNGSGKTSLLRCLGGITEASSGTVTFDEQILGRLGGRQRSRRIAFVGQNPTTEVDLTVADVVALGRIPHRGRLSGLSEADRVAICSALDRVELANFADRRWRTLSGGEKQRTQLARAFAQEAPVMLLDEPTNHLDIRSQLQLMRLIRESPEKATAVVLHDIQLAATICTRIAVIDRGRVVADGAPEAVLTTGLLADVFGISADVVSGGPDSMMLRYVGVV
ncbi:MAG: ABC transporter ATP-binding protein [Rhodococcus sp.]|nr:ABC transporter ATP-binding protein [Rhodococcus sp. (in: high G+C Gram-positive bacteria)]